LRVSPAAVSQQVKNLERFFDKQLFVRHHNRLSLTDAGLAVFADSSEALERLAARRCAPSKAKSAPAWSSACCPRSPATG
jgi:DNA-binding transcriptional LysR family regulator